MLNAQMLRVYRYIYFLSVLTIFAVNSLFFLLIFHSSQQHRLRTHNINVYLCVWVCVRCVVCGVWCVCFTHFLVKYVVKLFQQPVYSTVFFFFFCFFCLWKKKFAFFFCFNKKKKKKCKIFIDIYQMVFF